MNLINGIKTLFTNRFPLIALINSQFIKKFGIYSNFSVFVAVGFTALKKGITSPANDKTNSKLIELN